MLNKNSMQHRLTSVNTLALSQSDVDETQA